MSNKTRFQFRVLKKYGVLPVFDGEVDRKNVKAPLAEGETFANWCERVIGKSSSDVLVYQLEQPTGQRHIQNMNGGGQELLALFRAHARTLLRKHTKNTDSENSEDEFDFDEFDFDKVPGLEEDLFGVSDISQEPWYVMLANTAEPECLKYYKARDYTLFNHGDHEEYSEEYGDAARRLIILNDISEYIEGLSRIFSVGNMDRASESADYLVNYIQTASETDALRAEISEAAESDRDRIEREHVKLFLGADLCHALYEMIFDMFSEFEDELEDLPEAEQFIGKLLIGKPLSTLRNCVDFLLEA
jgi:hypothetical protein